MSKILFNKINKEPTGFLDPSAVVINYDPATQKVTLTGTITAYYQGTDISVANPTFVSGWLSAAHPDVTGHTYFLYYNGTAFVWADNSFPGFDMVLIAVVNYDATNKYCVRECHGLMQWQTHKELHETIGTYKTAGGTFPSAQYVLNSTTAANRRPDIDQTTITDEDCPSVLPALTSKSYTIYNLTGASVGAYTLASGDIIPLLVNNPYYNTFNTPNWGQTLMPANSVASVWVYALPVTASAGSQAYRYLFIQPQWVTQAQGPSAGQIATAVATEKLRLPSELNLGSLTLQTPELVCIGRIIIDFTTNWRLQDVSVITGNKFSQIGSPSGNFLSTVVTDATLTGGGTVASPLAVAAPYINPVSGTINEIGYFDTTGSVKSLAVATYPSLTELSYVKGVTSAIQTQLGTKQGTLTNSAGLSTAIGGDVAVVDGGTGLSAIAALSTIVANSANTYVAITPGAGQSIRINAGNTAWEAYTPGVGTVTGSGTTNELSYWTSATAQGTLAVATYPSLTEVSYVKGLTSSAQTQISAKAPIASPTFTGNVTLPAGSHPLNGYFNLASPASDHTCTGTATNAFQSGATIAQMNLVYMGSSSKWLIVDADAIATSGGLIGIAMEAKNDTQSMLVALPGSFVRDDSWSWTIGATLYAGETAGAIQATIPTGADGVIRVIGFAVSATVIFFNPSSDNSTTVA